MGWARRIKDALRGGDEAPDAAPAPATEPRPQPTTATPATATPDGVLEALTAEVVRESEGRLQASEIDVDGHMYDCGYVDSLSSVTLLGFIESEFGVAIEDTELVGRLDTLAKLAAFIDQTRK